MLVAASEFNHPETFRKQINNVFNINKYFVFIGQQKEEMFYLMMHSTHFIYGYMDSGHYGQRRNLLPPLHELFFF